MSEDLTWKRAATPLQVVTVHDEADAGYGEFGDTVMSWESPDDASPPLMTEVQPRSVPGKKTSKVSALQTAGSTLSLIQL